MGCRLNSSGALSRGGLLGLLERARGLKSADMAAVSVRADVVNLCCQATVLSNLDLVLAADLGVMAVLELAARETLTELALLEVCDGVLAKGYVFGEEIVEVVRDERVVDTTSETKRRQKEEGGQEASEATAASGLGCRTSYDFGTGCRGGRRRGNGGTDGLGGGRSSRDANGRALDWRSGSFGAELRRFRHVAESFLAVRTRKNGLVRSTDVGKGSLDAIVSTRQSIGRLYQRQTGRTHGAVEQQLRDDGRGARGAQASPTPSQRSTKHYDRGTEGKRGTKRGVGCKGSFSFDFYITSLQLPGRRLPSVHAPSLLRYPAFAGTTLLVRDTR